MRERLRPNSGQSSLPEYVVGFFIVIGVVVAMTAYVQRGLQARVFDARNYMVKSAVEGETNFFEDKNFMTAVGGKVSTEYEPYYGQAGSQVERTSLENTRLLQGPMTGIFRKAFNEQTQAQSSSAQLPPKDAQ